MSISADISKTGDANHICMSCKHINNCDIIVMHYGKFFDCSCYEMRPDYQVTPMYHYVVVVMKSPDTVSEVFGPFSSRCKATTFANNLKSARASRNGLVNTEFIVRKVKKY